MLDNLTSRIIVERPGLVPMLIASRKTQIELMELRQRFADHSEVLDIQFQIDLLKEEIEEIEFFVSIT